MMDFATVQARHLSYQRGKRNTNPNTSLVQIEGVATPKDATFYCGKKVAFVYKGKSIRAGTKIRVRRIRPSICCEAANVRGKRS